MKTSNNKTITGIVENFLMIGTVFIIAITAIIMMIAMVDTTEIDKEAEIGSFDVYDFNYGWTMTYDGKSQTLSLPSSFDCEPGSTVTLTNRLPDNLSDGMSLMFRANMQDVVIDIDGQTRLDYSSKNSPRFSYYLPSAYLVSDLNAEDSGKEINITITFKINSAISGATISYGNNVWYPVVRNALPTNLIALLVLILGIIICIAVSFLWHSYSVSTPGYLGLLMIDVALWVFSESSIRQFIFKRATLSQYFAYITVELICLLACMYFDAVQHRFYHKIYLVLEAVSFILVVVNIALHLSGICEFYNTIVVSHIWTAVCSIVSTGCIIKDFISKRIKSYHITGIGMITFMLVSMGELVNFYVNRFHIFGSYLCIALMVLMTATIIQTIYDEVNLFHEREKIREEVTINTIETIAGAIEARDEYTGGHSERVGLYASRLAREMAADYDLSEDDILQIQYIGLVHDIGKVGVADSVLNKSGKLTDEEFSLMKKHTEIGYEMMSAVGSSMPGLLEGIRYHHERFDGKGYPDGLADTDIPLVARVLALADSYDAMTSNRVYRKRLSDEEVREEILRCAGTQFDPTLSKIFVNLLDRGEIRACSFDESNPNRDGQQFISHRLENRLQKDVLDKGNIVHPSRIRMLCYVIKLMEKKGKSYSVFFVGMNKEIFDKEKWDEMREIFGNLIVGHDINIQYTDRKNIIALYDRSDNETQQMMNDIITACPSSEITML